MDTLIMLATIGVASFEWSTKHIGVGWAVIFAGFALAYIVALIRS